MTKITLHKFIGQTYAAAVILGVVAGAIAALIEWRTHGILSGGESGLWSTMPAWPAGALWLAFHWLNRKRIETVTQEGRELAHDAGRIAILTLFPTYWFVLSLACKMDLLIHGMLIVAGVFWVGIACLTCKFMQVRAMHPREQD